MKIKSEYDILNESTRKKIIEEIEGQENIGRKKEAFKRYETYKDQTAKYVEDLLRRQFDAATVDEMKYSISNISIVRKIIDKLARVYSNGVERELGRKKDTEKLAELNRLLKFDQTMKKANRGLELQKNIMMFVKPKKVVTDDGLELYCPKVMALQPFLYDVVEDPNDKEQPMCLILSSYDPMNQELHSLSPATEGRGYKTPGINEFPSGDRKEQLIADTPFDTDGDMDKKLYIWWSKNYHFTTNSKGSIVSGSDIENPIHEKNFVNIAEDQDGQFWAVGGNDLIDGGILVNSMISNTNHIGIVQGYGQPVMTGKNLPQRTKVGPNFMIKLEQNDGEPTPDFKYVTANPPLSDLKDLIVMYISLMLTTNNLSTSGVRTSLEGSSDFASGIAMMIDKAESVEDVADQARLFYDVEPAVWSLVFKWMKIYEERNLLCDDFAGLVPSKIDERVVLKLGEAKPIITENEQLDVMLKKYDMGIMSKVDMIRSMHPEMTEEQAKEKLKQILEEKMLAMASRIVEGEDGMVEEVPGEELEGNASESSEEPDDEEEA